MGTISRPAKGGGANTYVGAVAAGFLDIIDSDLDADFTTIYGEFNGHISDANIVAGAAIARAKLNLAGGIGNADIAPHSLVGSTVLAPNTVTSTEITNNTITATDLAIGATTPASINIAVTTGPIVSASVETLIAESTWTARGGFTLAHGTVGGFILSFGLPVNTTLRLKYGGTPGLPDGTPLDAASNQVGPPSATFPLGMTVMGLVVLLTGPQRLKLTMTCDLASGVTVQTGRLILLEFA